MGRRGYPPEVRRRALEQVAAGRSVFQVAMDIGVSVQVIYSWRKQAASQPGAGESTPSD